MTRSVIASPEDVSAAVDSGVVSHPDHAPRKVSERASNSPPLKSRIQANRENARKSTGPKTAEGKAASRANALKHGLTARDALPGETVSEIASHFWQIVEAHRPVDAVAVNAMLELAICSWKFRRLFEHYVGHNAVNRLTVNEIRMAREKRNAQKWFRSLAHDARKSLAHLETSFAGLTMIVENLENLTAELDQPEGSWTSAQFMLAVNLAGFDEHEIWDNIQLRSLWTAWYACRPGRKAALMESQSFLPACPEYRTRARNALETAPLPAEGRRRLLEWTSRLREAVSQRIEVQGQVENELRELQTMASGWPAPEETSQHLLYLRYSNQVDRKTRELNAIIAARPSRSGDDSWKFDENMLPSDWKAALLQHRNGSSREDVLENPYSNASVESRMDEMQTGIDDETLKDLIFEALIAKQVQGLVSETSDAGQSLESEPLLLEGSMRNPASNDNGPSLELHSHRQMELEKRTGPSISNSEIESMSGPLCVSFTDTSRPEVDDGTNRLEIPGPDLNGTQLLPIEGVCELPISIAASSTPDRAVAADPELMKNQRQVVETGQNRSQDPTHRQSRRKLRKDKAAEVRKGRHLHGTRNPAKPIEPRIE